MAFIADILILVIILNSVWSGYKKGLVKTVFSCLSLIAAIVLAGLFGSDVGSIMRESSGFENLSETISAELSEQFDKMIEKGMENIESGQHDELANVLKRIGVDTDDLYDRYRSTLAVSRTDAKELVAENAANVIADCLATAAGVLCVFILSLVALKIVCYLIDGIFKLPLLSSVNKIGGLIVGAVFGLLGAFMLCLGISVILPYLPQNPVFYVGMEKGTVLYNFFVNFNPIILILFS